MFSTWMQDNKSDQWSEELYFVQFIRNRDHHSLIKRTSYKALFSCRPKVSLTTYFLHQDVLKGINTEEHLEKLMQKD